ncbi:MAG: ABC transporter permease [Lachnospiraceae bacterium]|nr:ABC transporter permease [Lachnospiraceae bacterium]
MSKLGIIIKNNLKLMLRNKIMVFAAIVSPVLVVAALSNAFHNLLDQAQNTNEFEVGYQMTENSQFSEYEEILHLQLEEEGISLRRYNGEVPEKIVEDGQIEVFIDFGDVDYHIYGADKNELQVRIIQCVMFIMTENVKAYHNGSSSVQQDLEVKELATTKTAGAQDYYSIIEVVYFLSLCVIFLSMIIQAEKGNHILTRFRVGNAGDATLYFGKMIPCVLMAWVIQILITGGLVTVMFDVTWGMPLISFLVLCLEAVAFTAFGMIFMLLFRNMAVSIGAMFMILWFMGFFGGTFETYMYSSVPDAVKELSPLYYLNRTLVELSTMGESCYLVPCVVYMLAIIIICIPAGILLTGRRREKNV